MDEVQVQVQVKEPKVDWHHLPFGKIFYDFDGSTWQIQKTDSGKSFPALVQEAPRSCLLFKCSYRRNHKKY